MQQARRSHSTSLVARVRRRRSCIVSLTRWTPGPLINARGACPQTSSLEHMASKLTWRTRSLRATLEGAAPPRQLPLLFGPRGSLVRPRRSSTPAVQKSERLPSLDQRMSTAEVLRVVGVNRSTLFRWTKRGRFPGKHVSGGWLRSDVERWLAGNRSTALAPSASRDSTVVSP